MMSPDQEDMLREVHDAIVGNPRIGNKGLVTRVQALEDHKDSDIKFRNKIIGGVAVGTPVGVAIWHFLMKKNYRRMNFIGTEQEKRDLILKIAASYVGVKESPAGTNNVIFNTRFYGKPVQDGINLKGEKDPNAKYPWCGTFDSEIFQEALLPLGNIGYLRGFAGCPYAVARLTDMDPKKRWGVEVSFENVQPGDIIFYDWNMDKKWDHTGILKSKDLKSRMFEAYEGNTAVGNDSNGGEVMDRPRKMFGGVKFVRPNVYE